MKSMFKALKGNLCLLLVFVLMGFSLPIYSQSVDSLIQQYTDKRGGSEYKSTVRCK